jgi:hypothetical protein
VQNASTFSNSLTLSGGSLSSGTFVTVGGPAGALTWSGGSLDGAGGTFLLAPGRSGVLSNDLSLNVLFVNSGLLTLSGATITGTGSITNFGRLTAIGANVVDRMLLAGGTVSGSGGLTVSDWSRTGGAFDMTGTADLRVPSGDFSVDQAYAAGSLTLQAPAGDIVLNAAVTGTGGGTTVALVAGGDFVNNLGAGAIDPGAGRFLVYSTDPANDTRGGLAYDFKQYNAAFGSTIVLGTGDGFLYTVAPVITPSLTGSATKVYDGGATAPTGSLALSGTGAIDGDTVALALAGATYDSRHAGTGKAVTANGLSVTASDGAAAVYGYQSVASTVSANIGEITPAALTLGAVSDTKVYDGTTSSAGTPAASGLMGGDTVSALSQSFASKNALGTHGSTLVVNGGYVVNDGNGGANYTVTADTATGTITPAALTGSITADSKVYDGTTAATISGRALAGVIGGDDVIYTGGTAGFDTRNAGAGKTVTATGLGLTGTDAGNYTVNATATATADITARPITVTAVSDAKVYDGTTSSSATPLLGGGLGAGDTAAFIQTFDDRNAGTGKTLTANGAVADGNGGANYQVSFVADTTGTIAPAALTITGVTAHDKVYDATTRATLDTGSAAVSGVLGGDAVTLNSGSATGAFADSNAGAGKPVAAAGFAIAGADAGNYSLAQPSGFTASIAPATLTYAANAAGRERGDPNPAFTGSVTGFVGGETLATATGGTLVFTSPANQASVEGKYAIDGGGLTANNGNYVFVQAPSNATALTVTAPVNFSWIAGTGGAWETGSNWNKGFAPVNGAVVTIPDVGAAGVTETVTFSGGTVSVRSVTSLEALTVAAGTLSLGTSSADVSSIPVVNLNGGTLSGAGTLNLASLNLSGGSLTGSLFITANVSNQGGTVTPGASPGALTINGNYAQGPGGTLVVEIGGTIAGSQYDQLIVNGNATLDGNLSVTLVDGFVPAGGETFTVVQSSGSVSGAFANTSFPASPTFNATYLSASVLVSASTVPVLPPTVVESTSQLVVAITDQNQNTLVASQFAAPQLDEHEDKEERDLKKKPLCNASSGAGGGGGGFGRGGASGGRCNTRGCF